MNADHVYDLYTPIIMDSSFLYRLSSTIKILPFEGNDKRKKKKKRKRNEKYIYIYKKRKRLRKIQEQKKKVNE